MIGFYEFFKISEQRSASTEVMLSNDPVIIDIPRFGGMSDSYKISHKGMAEELEYSIINVNGEYQLYDNFKNIIVYKNRELKKVIEELVRNFTQYMMGALKRRRNPFGGKGTSARLIS